MEHFAKIVKISLQTLFEKSFILDVLESAG